MELFTPHFVDRSSCSPVTYVKSRHPSEETLLVQVTARYLLYYEG